MMKVLQNLFLETSPLPLLVQLVFLFVITLYYIYMLYRKWQDEVVIKSQIRLWISVFAASLANLGYYHLVLFLHPVVWYLIIVFYFGLFTSFGIQRLILHYLIYFVDRDRSLGDTNQERVANKEVPFTFQCIRVLALAAAEIVVLFGLGLKILFVPQITVTAVLDAVLWLILFFNYSLKWIWTGITMPFSRRGLEL